MDSTKPDVLVTGATGTVGRQVVTGLLDAGSTVRALVRDPASVRLPEGAETAGGDLANPASLKGALDGIGTVFLVWPFTSRRAAIEIAPAVIDEITRRARRVVYLSADAASDDPASFWSSIEHVVEASGSEWTFLRPTGFAKNTLMWADQIRAGDVVRWPYGAASRSLIDERDVAAVAVRALTEDSHHGATYVLSGPEALTQRDQVHAIGAALGRTLRWEDVPRDEARPALVSAMGDAAFADHALDTWAGFVDRPERTTSTVNDVTGTPAHTMSDWASAHTSDFR
ncbi:MAG: NAD(P)H-binding protein [Actinomycetota bacterium]|nr:NAD(P)H-binding protein [Actinomycetota bacterium]